jgi:hypothetical protein
MVSRQKCHTKSEMSKWQERKKKPLKNPFVYEGYEGPSYFCDRTEETEKVISHLQNGRNLTLVSPRKVGKTGLIKHVFQRLKQEDEDNRYSFNLQH